MEEFFVPNLFKNGNPCKCFSNPNPLSRCHQNNQSQNAKRRTRNEWCEKRETIWNEYAIRCELAINVMENGLSVITCDWFIKEPSPIQVCGFRVNRRFIKNNIYRLKVRLIWETCNDITSVRFRCTMLHKAVIVLTLYVHYTYTIMPK